jgi:Ca2+-binding RTX toxin-like protein
MRTILALLVSAAAIAAGAVELAPAATTPPCAGSRAVPNALTTTSADGTVVYGSPCPDKIVVTSPAVREVQGGEGDDVIFANPDVEVVDGGPGNDTIYGELPETETGAGAGLAPEGEGEPEGIRYSRAAKAPLASASITEVNCKEKISCYGGIGSQELIGSSGNDKIFGQRGNDILKGNSGNDELFGGVGDDSLISGGAGDDLLSGGLGTDTLNGNQGSDLVRGDGTTDTIEDTGSEGTDTLSFATAVTPGFSGAVGISGFPGEAESEERGVYVRLDGTPACGEYAACDNNARFGGGNDVINVSGFENVIGSPFDDVIVGSSGANRIDGGGGADVIYGGEGNDTLYGGADGDYLKGEGGTDTVYGQGGNNNCSADSENRNQCSGSAEAVTQRDTSKISVGFMATNAATPWVALYLTGSSGKDRVTATFGFEGPTGYVTFATEGESAQFDTSEGAQTENCSYEATKVKCTLPKPLDAIVMAGMAGDDRLALNISESYWETTTPIILGGEGNDELLGSGHTEDLLVDGNGPGNDVLKAFAYDDGLLNNEGADVLEGGNGNDLLLSSGLCEGDTLQGAESGAADGAAQNSVSFAKVPEGAGGVVVDLESEGEWKGTAGDTYSSGPTCGSGSLDKVRNIDDVEGTNNADIIYGDSHENNLLGRPGKDQIWARGGNDNVEAKDEVAEEGGGGAGTDTCTLDASDKFSSCNP